MVVFLGPWVAQIPMAALVAVMIMVSIGTFSWESIKTLKTLPVSTNIVMIATVVIVVATHNLAIGVIAGVLLSALFFANKAGQLLHIDRRVLNDGDIHEYHVIGQLFFASTTRFSNAFDFREAPSIVRIDLHRAHLWGTTAVEALDRVIIKLRREGTEVSLEGLNEASATLVDRFAVHDDPVAAEKLMGGH